MKITLLLIIVMTGILMSCDGESLWDDDFQGYLTPETRISQGDILIVVIDTSFSLSHISTQKDSKTISFEYTGGEYSNLFSFLPDISTGVDNSARGNEKYTLSSDIVARIVSLEEKSAYIEGAREITIDGKKESVTISGRINTKDINQQKRVSFSKIADARLVYKTFLYPSDSILSEEDIEDIVEEIVPSLERTMPDGELLSDQPEEPLPGEEESTAGTTDESEITDIPLLPEKTTPELSKEKKKELFLRYLNRKIDLLFY